MIVVYIFGEATRLHVCSHGGSGDEDIVAFMRRILARQHDYMFAAMASQCCSWAASPAFEPSSMWGKRKAENVFQNQPKSTLCIVRRLAPSHCTDADTVIHNDDSHIQNDAMLDTVSKAFPSPVTHNVQPPVQPQFSTPGSTDL
ncbi:hypothetical protein Tco_1369918 [Tanacetum coccineum]